MVCTKSWCPKQDRLWVAGLWRWSAVQELRLPPRLASCSAVPQPGRPSTFPGRRLALGLAEAGLKSSCAGLPAGRGTLLPPLQLTHTLAQRSGCADALAFRFPSSGTQSGIVKAPDRIILCMSLHEKYADSDETISTPMQLPASVSPSVMSGL